MNWRIANQSVVVRSIRDVQYFPLALSTLVLGKIYFTVSTPFGFQIFKNK